MKAPGSASTFFILVWFLILISVFVIVTVPAEGRVATVLPDFFWKLRELIYPLFSSPSVY